MQEPDQYLTDIYEYMIYEWGRDGLDQILVKKGRTTLWEKENGEYIAKKQRYWEWDRGSLERGNGGYRCTWIQYIFDAMRYVHAFNSVWNIFICLL